MMVQLKAREIRENPRKRERERKKRGASDQGKTEGSECSGSLEATASRVKSEIITTQLLSKKMADQQRRAP
jgi:hypothetical protein